MANAAKAEDIVVDVGPQTERPKADEPKPTGRQRRDSTTSRQTASGKGKGRSRPELSPEIIAASTASWERIIGMVLMGAQVMVPPPFAPTPAEAAGVHHPLSNIAGRRWVIPEISGDAEDAVALVVGVMSYGFRVAGDIMAGQEQSAPPPQTPPTPIRPDPPAYRQAEAEAAHEAFRTAGMEQPGEPRAEEPGESVGIPPEKLVGTPEQVLQNVYEELLNGPMVQGQQG